MHEIPRRHAERLEGFGIRLGAPRLDSRYPELPFLAVPEIPHVFFSESLYLVEPESQIASLQATLDKEGISVPVGRVQVGNVFLSAIELHGVMTMLGHGLVTGREEYQWVFRETGRSVSATVDAYNGVARDLLWLPVDVIVCCREEQSPPLQVQIRFNYRRSNAVIFPVSLATVKNYPRHASLAPGVGAQIVVEAREWSAVSWFRTWTMTQNRWLRKFRSVPSWAKEWVT